MPASLINLTEGAGKALETWQWVIGANTVERQVIAMGEQHLASYVFTTGAVSTATANSHLIQIMAGASLKVRIRRVEVHLTAVATAVALLNMTPVRLTTAGTGGTVLGVNGNDPSDGAAGATSMTLPTVKGTEGTGAIWSQYPYMMQTLAASAPLVQPIAVWDWDRPRFKPFIIAAGAANGFAIKNTAAVAGATVSITILFEESNF